MFIHYIEDFINNWKHINLDTYKNDWKNMELENSRIIRSSMNNSFTDHEKINQVR